MKKTKIVSTLGPASSDLDTICKLIEAGANVFRFNFSHGDHEEHLGRINLVHQAEKITGKMVGIMLDTKGAEIRTTVQKEGKIKFEIGDEVRISMDDSIEGTHEKIAVTYPGLYDDVHEGGHVLFDDGLIDMQVEKKDEANHELVCKVLNEGVLGSRKGVNAPGVSINLPGITKKMLMIFVLAWTTKSTSSLHHSYVSLKTFLTFVNFWKKSTWNMFKSSLRSNHKKVSTTSTISSRFLMV